MVVVRWNLIQVIILLVHIFMIRIKHCLGISFYDKGSFSFDFFDIVHVKVVGFIAHQ